MYIIRRDRLGKRSFKTYDGWVQVTKDTALDLADAMRFTKGERECFKLGEGEEFVWFGCYNKE